MMTTMPRASRKVWISEHRGVIGKPHLCQSHCESGKSNAESVACQRGEGGLKKNHEDQDAAACADRLQSAELIDIFEDEGVKRLPRDGETHDEADARHQHDVHAEAGLKI